MRGFCAQSGVEQNAQGKPLGVPLVHVEPRLELDEDGLVECGVCMDDVVPADMLSCGCSHAFCVTCWGGDIHVRMNGMISQCTEVRASPSVLPCTPAGAPCCRAAERDQCVRDAISGIQELWIVWCSCGSCGVHVDRGLEDGGVACNRSVIAVQQSKEQSTPPGNTLGDQTTNPNTRVSGRMELLKWHGSPVNAWGTEVAVANCVTAMLSCKCHFPIPLINRSSISTRVRPTYTPTCTLHRGPAGGSLFFCGDGS